MQAQSIPGDKASLSSAAGISPGDSLSNTCHLIAHVANSNIWHARMGHVPANVLKQFPVEYANKIVDVCDSCYFAKQSRIPFPDSDTQSSNLFDLVHADLWGPYRFKTYDNCHMFLTLVEDNSRTTWVYLLSDKASVSTILKHFVAYIQTQFHTTLKVLRSIFFTRVGYYTPIKLCLHSTAKWLSGA